MACTRPHDADEPSRDDDPAFADTPDDEPTDADVAHRAALHD